MPGRFGDETIRDARLVLSTDPLVGQLVEQYRVESVIGTGAMGIVYRGVHQVIGKAAAIKVLKADIADDPGMVQRLVQEARTVNAIRHSSIVDIFGFGTLPRTGQPYIVMDLLEGDPLDVYIKEHAPIAFKEAYAFLDETLSALAAAHAVGVIHRDLKPGNIFVETRADGLKGIKIIDFGLAKRSDRRGGSVKPTNPGTLLGTPAFMAPEQVLGTKVTPATDLYAVGGIAYQMLTNHFPHEGNTAIDVLSLKMHEDPVPPNKWQPQLDEELVAWVMKLLAREPEKRMKDAEEARKSLRRLFDGRTNTRIPSVIFDQETSPPLSARPATGATKRNWGDAKTVISNPGVDDGLKPIRIAEAPKPSDGRPPEPSSAPTAPLIESPFARSRSDARTIQALASEVPGGTEEPAAPLSAPEAPDEVGLESTRSYTSLHRNYLVLGIGLLALLGALVWLVFS